MMISWTIHGNSLYLKHNYHELITNYHQLNLSSYLLMSYCVQKYTFCTEIEVRNIEKRLFPPLRKHAKWIFLTSEHHFL